jgi:hypothetical protein
MEPNLDCQDPNARRTFTTSSDLVRTCGEVVGWVLNNPVFEHPTAIIGTTERGPRPDDCLAEIHLYGRYALKAQGPHDAVGDASWRLKLAADSHGFGLTVVLGAPPRVP